MKLQKQVSRTYKNKENKEKGYLKYFIIIPRETIKKLGWENLEELGEIIDINNNKLILKKK